MVDVLPQVISRVLCKSPEVKCTVYSRGVSMKSIAAPRDMHSKIHFAVSLDKVPRGKPCGYVDQYYDFKDYRLLKKGMWLSKRTSWIDGSYEWRWKEFGEATHSSATYSSLVSSRKLAFHKIFYFVR